MRFRLVPKSSTLDDPERPWTAKTQSGAEKVRVAVDIKFPIHSHIHIHRFFSWISMGYVHGYIHGYIHGYTHGLPIACLWLTCTRSLATAERQRVSYTRLSRLTHWTCTSLSTASVLQQNRLAKLVSTLSANKPCDICTLSWIGHSRSFKVILGHKFEWR